MTVTLFPTYTPLAHNAITESSTLQANCHAQPITQLARLQQGPGAAGNLGSGSGGRSRTTRDPLQSPTWLLTLRSAPVTP